MELQEERLSRALSAFQRRQILRLLANQELTVKEIASKTQMSMSLASRHLKLLYDLGFVNTKTKPPLKFYSLRIKELIELITVYDRIVNTL